MRSARGPQHAVMGYALAFLAACLVVAAFGAALLAIDRALGAWR